MAEGWVEKSLMDRGMENQKNEKIKKWMDEKKG